MQGNRCATGHITIVQETRFRLVTDDGRGLLFTLDRGAPPGAAELCRLRDAGERVRVEYRGEPDLAGAVAGAVLSAGRWSPRGSAASDGGLRPSIDEEKPLGRT